MAAEFRLIAEIKASDEIRGKLESWVRKLLPESERDRLMRTCNYDADYNFMGLIPCVIDEKLEQMPKDLAWRAFCDGGSNRCDDSTIELYFRASEDACEDLWEYIREKYEDVQKIRVYVDPDYEEDIEDLGEDDLFSYERK